MELNLIAAEVVEVNVCSLPSCFSATNLYNSMYQLPSNVKDMRLFLVGIARWLVNTSFLLRRSFAANLPYSMLRYHKFTKQCSSLQP